MILEFSDSTCAMQSIREVFGGIQVRCGCFGREVLLTSYACVWCLYKSYLC